MKNLINKENCIELLVNFVKQRAGICARDYFFNWQDINGRQAYNQDVREVARDRAIFNELLSLSTLFLYPEELSAEIYNRLKDSNGRLLIVNGKLTYHVGQYFPTEYRKAACRLLTSILWDYFYKKLARKKETVTANDIRNEAKKYLTRKTFQTYFN